MRRRLVARDQEGVARCEGRAERGVLKNEPTEKAIMEKLASDACYSVSGESA